MLPESGNFMLMYALESVVAFDTALFSLKGVLAAPHMCKQSSPADNLIAIVHTLDGSLALLEHSDNDNRMAAAGVCVHLSGCKYAIGLAPLQDLQAVLGAGYLHNSCNPVTISLKIHNSFAQTLASIQLGDHDHYLTHYINTVAE